MSDSTQPRPGSGAYTSATPRGRWRHALDPFDLKVLLRALLVPPASTLLLGLVGLLLALRGRRAGLPLAFAGLAATWLLCSYAVAHGLASWAEAGQRPFDRSAWDTARNGPSPPGAVVILGGGAIGDGPGATGKPRLSANALQRVVIGARVARMTGLPVLVTGGVPRGLSEAEATLMREMLEGELSVPVRWVEDRARDTAENAALSARLLKADGVRSIVLVTHALHMSRSRAAFEAAGLVVHPAPHDWMSGPSGPLEPRSFWPNARALVITWQASHELMGRLWYRMRGSG